MARTVRKSIRAGSSEGWAIPSICSAVRPSLIMPPQLIVFGSVMPEEGEAALGDDGDGDDEQAEGEHRQDDVGQDLPHEDPLSAGAGGLRGEHELALRVAERGRARDAGEVGDRHEADADQDVREVLAEEGHDRDQEEERGEGEEDVDHRHQQRLGASPHEAGDQPDRAADGHADDEDAEADDEGHAAAPDEAGEDVVAVLVGAEEVALGADGGVLRHEEVGIVGLVDREDRRQDRRDRHEHEPQQAEPPPDAELAASLASSLAAAGRLGCEGDRRRRPRAGRGGYDVGHHAPALRTRGSTTE